MLAGQAHFDEARIGPAADQELIEFQRSVIVHAAIERIGDQHWIVVGREDDAEEDQQRSPRLVRQLITRGYRLHIAPRRRKPALRKA